MLRDSVPWPASVATYSAVRPFPCRVNRSSVTSRRRHERTCSAVCPHASATGYTSLALIVPSSCAIPSTSTLVGIGTVVLGTTKYGIDAPAGAVRGAPRRRTLGRSAHRGRRRAEPGDRRDELGPRGGL